MSKSILSPKLTYNQPTGFYISDDGYDWAFCKDILRHYFDVPKDAKQIQIRAYDEPGPGRTTIKLVHYDDVTWSGVLIDGSTGRCAAAAGDDDSDDREYIVHETQDAIKKLAGRRKTWYVDVYYWEED